MTSEVRLSDDAARLGAYLRSAREARGMSLNDAARITRIGKAYLESLEADRYDRLPSPAYVKGIIRSYADVLGIPSGTLVARYEQVTESDEAGGVESGRRDSHRPGRKQWILILLIGVVITVIYIIAQRDSTRERPAQPAETAMPAPAPEKGVQPARTSHFSPASQASVPVKAPIREESAEESTSTNSAGVVLRVRVNEECLLIITVDDETPQQYDLKAGDRIEWKGERYFALELSNAGAIEADLNGRPLPSLGKGAAPATVVITADGQIH